MTDETERDYIRAIAAALARSDEEAAIELNVGLTEYRRYFKVS